MAHTIDIRQTVADIVTACITETNTNGWSQIALEEGDAASILAGAPRIDSFGLVSLLVMIEQDMDSQLGCTSNLSTGIAAATGEINPLATMGTLIAYILQQLDAYTGVSA